MSLNHLLASLGLARPEPQGVEAQLHAMRREVRRISRALSSRADHTVDDWSDHISDWSREAARQGSHLAELATEQASRGARAVRRDPLPAIAVVGTALLIASLFRR